MRRWTLVSALALTALLTPLLTTGVAHAQTYDRDDRDDDGGDHDRFALGVGIGLVEPLNEVETYYMASLRIRVSGRDGDNSNRREDEGITGYLEPEIGYWQSTADNAEGSDLLLGVNLIGVVPFGAVDSFFGVGAGVHSLDTSLLEANNSLSGTETKFGANAQFGIDIFISRKLSAFGTGRFDLVQGSQDQVQTKVYLGLRARF
jgi:hypothetical protein